MRFVCRPAWFLALMGLCATGMIRAQETAAPTVRDYRTAWRAGDYAEAARLLDALVSGYEHFVPLSLSEDQAKLYTEIGRIDEAITIYETLVRRYGELYHRVELVELLRYRGRLEEASQIVADAISYALRDGKMGFTEENWLALSQLSEMGGENPKDILNARMKSLISVRPDFVPAYLYAGSVAYRNYGYAQAANYFDQALLLEPENQEALAGLARCYARSSDPRLEALLKALTQINPNNPDARLIQAEELLASDQFQEVVALCDAVLGINANHLDALALKGAALFLLDDTESLERVFEISKAFNPVSCRAEYQVGRFASLHYRFAEGAAWQEKALSIDPANRDAKAQLGLDQLRLGNNEAGRATLEAAFQTDPYNVQVFNMLEVLDSLEKFERLSSPNFEVHLPEKEAVFLGGEVRALLEEAIARYETAYAVTLARPVAVQIFDDHDEFMVRSVGLPGNPGHLGICFGQLVTMDSPGARKPGAMNWESVLWHEFVHCVTLQKTKNRMARWLSEGISVYEETRRNPAWGQALEPEFAALIDMEALPGMGELGGYFTNPETPGHLMLGYFLAGELASCYVAQYGQAALNAALDAIGAGEKTEIALLNAAQKSAEELDAVFREHLRTRCAPLQNLPPALPVADATALPELTPWMERPSRFTNALAAAAAAVEAGDLTSAETYLREAHALYPDYRAHDAPLYRLVQLHKDHGKAAEQEAVLREIVAWDHLALHAAKELAGMQAALGDWEGVQESTALARAIDPFDLEMLALRKDAFRHLNDPASALALVERLIAAAPAAPLSHEVERIHLLRALGRTSEARHAAVRLLEAYPQFAAAQDALLEAVGAPDES
ncbi:MAG: hypothetical protein HYV27_16110 [Candidatus Hydrogenedentes bacterium]|nr:hypothetical protein [Candidatus Hydrogenedentota bacterium]